MIAFTVCLCMGRSFDFNLFDMDEIQWLSQGTERVYNSVDGNLNGLVCSFQLFQRIFWNKFFDNMIRSKHRRVPRSFNMCNR